MGLFGKVVIGWFYGVNDIMIDMTSFLFPICLFLRRCFLLRRRNLISDRLLSNYLDRIVSIAP